MNSFPSLEQAMTAVTDEVGTGLDPTSIRRRATVIRRRRRLAVSASAIAIAAATVAVFGQGPSGSFSRDPVAPATHAKHPWTMTHPMGVMRWQEEINPYISHLMRTARAEPNFSGGQYLNGSHGFIVKGVGQPSSAVKALMGQAPGSLSVRWQSVPFTDNEIDQAVRDVWGYRLVVMSSEREPNLDGIVVQVHLDGQTTKEEARAAVEAQIHNGVTAYVIFGPSSVVAQ